MRWVSVAPRLAPRMALSSSRSCLRIVGQALAQQLQTAQHRHQQIVEIMRHAAGQLADRFHLLRLEQRLARPLQRLLRLLCAR